MHTLHTDLRVVVGTLRRAHDVHIAGGMSRRVEVHVVYSLARGLVKRGQRCLIGGGATASEIWVLSTGVHALRIVHSGTGKLAGEMREVESCDGTPRERGTEPRAVDGAGARCGLRGTSGIRGAYLHGIFEVPLGVDGYGGVGELLGEVEWLVGGGIVPTGELVALAGRGSGLLLTERLLVGLPVGNGLGI